MDCVRQDLFRDASFYCKYRLKHGLHPNTDDDPKACVVVVLVELDVCADVDVDDGAPDVDVVLAIFVVPVVDCGELVVVLAMLVAVTVPVVPVVDCGEVDAVPV